MASLIVAGDTSGSVTIAAPAVASTPTLTLPTVSGTFITTGSSGQIIPKAALPTGSVLQVVSTTKTDTFSTTSTTFTDVTGLSVSITPTSSSSKILLILSLSCSSDGNRDGNFQILRGSSVMPTAGITGPLINASNGAYINSMLTMVQSFVDSPATTSSTTYKVQASINADRIYVNRRALDTSFTGQSTITVMEIAA